MAHNFLHEAGGAKADTVLMKHRMHRMQIFTLLAICLLTILTRAATYPTRFNGTTWDDDHWRLTTTELDQGHYQSRMSLANGYLGINLAAVGPFFEVDTPVDGDLINGWPLFDRRQTFATIAGFYDYQPTTNASNFPWLYQYGGESVISGVPHWAGLHVQIGEQVLDAGVPKSQISNFSSTLDVKAGTMSWSYTWSPDSESTIDIEYIMMVHKLHVNQAATQLKMTASQQTNATVIDVLNGDCALRTTPTDKGYEPDSPLIYSAVNPNGIENVTAYLVSIMMGDDSCHSQSRRQYEDESVIGSNRSSVAQAMDVTLGVGKPTTVTKYVGGASNDAFEKPKEVAIQRSCGAAEQGFESLLASHTAEWRSIMTEDSVDSYRLPENSTIPDDDNILDLQIMSITNPFQLLQNTVGRNAIAAAGNNTKLDVNSIAVGGLSSDSYAGMIFWDADVWMAPGLLVAHPQAAKQIANYRVEKFPQAQANVRKAYQSSKNDTDFSPNGAVYSWTSGRFGNCTATGPCFDYEYHLNGDIGLSFTNYLSVTGDTDFFRESLFPIHNAVSTLFADLVKFNETSGSYELYNATDPDEFANHVDNAGFTMVLMKTHLKTGNNLHAMFGLEENTTWANISSLIEVPINDDADIILEYQTMNNTVSVKQADVILVDDFLNYPNPYSNNDLDYYAGKQSQNGPAMTYGVFSVVANEISPSGCSSYTYDLYGSHPYLRGPWYQFSEQLVDDFEVNGGFHPAYPFLTGVGGAHRVAVFGYLGLRLMVDSLNVDPSLPPQIPHLDYRTIYWQGWPINATSNQTHTTLTRLSTPLEDANATFADSSIPVTRGVDETHHSQLPPNGTIVLTNRQIGQKKTIPGNVAQCQPVSSAEEYEPGQFPLAAVDGAVSTKWQPTQSNISSSITVKLPEPFVPITAIALDWAQSPPQSYSVTFSNSTSSADSVVVASSNNVSISNAYDAASAAVIVPYMSNTTNVTLETPVYSGRFATLSIRGNQATVGTANENNGTGASVAEWALVGPSGDDALKRHAEVWAS